ncbi:hypothetical protein CSB09_00005, partial [Candidatus Gracilibacteria bacterium]
MKKLLFSLLGLFVFLTMGNITQAATPEACFNFDTVSKTITGYYDNEGNVGTNPACPRDVDIPAQIAGVDVEIIGANAFNTKNITSVILPNTVKTIGKLAFGVNGIQSITIPDSVETIEENAFYKNKIINLTISDNVKTIGTGAFYINKIQNLTLGKGLKTIGFATFSSNKITTLVIHDNVETIGERAFSSNKLSRVYLPDSLINVGEDAFKNNTTNPVIGVVSWDLTDPANAQKIEDIEGAVADNDVSFLKLENECFTFDAATKTITDYLDTCAKNVLIPKQIKGVDVEHIGDNAFKNKALTSVVFLGTIKTIGTQSFDTNKLSEIILPDSLTNVGKDAFKNNTTDPVIGKVFWDPTLPANQTKKENIEGTVADDDISFLKLEKECFTFDAGTKRITNYSDICSKDVVIPAQISGINVEIIGDDAFKNKALTSVVIPDTVKTIGFQSFAENQIQTLTFGTGVKIIGLGAFEQNKIQNIVIPDSVEIISQGAFWTNQIQNLTLGSSVKTIGESAFSKNNIQNLTISNNVETIEKFAFAENQIQNLTLGSSVKTIGEKAFYKNKLSKINIPDSLTNVGVYAFLDNATSKVIGKTSWDPTLPANAQRKEDIEGTSADGDLSMLKLEGGCFIFDTGTKTITGYDNYCPKDVNIPAQIAGENVEHIGDNAFDQRNITSVVIPDTVKTIGKKAFILNQIQNLTLGNGVKTIANSAFSSNKIQNLTIPDSLETIGQNVFENNQIQSLTLGNNLKTIGLGAFHKNKIQNLTISDNVETIGTKAFAENQIQTLIFGNNVKNILFEAFYKNKLREVYLPGSLINVGKDAFKNNTNNPVIGIVFWNPALPANAQKKEDIEGTVADDDVSFLKLKQQCFIFDIGTKTITDYIATCTKNVIIPNQIKGVDVENIGDNAFKNKNITSVAFPNTVKTIGNAAFANNQIGTGGAVLTLPDSLTQVWPGAFSGNAVNPVPGEVSWDPAAPANQTRRENIEGTGATTTFLKLQQKIISGGSSSSVGPGGSSSSSSSPAVTIDESATQETQTGEVVTPQPKPIVKPKDEMQQAYEWSYTRGITTMNTLEKARVHDTITRAELAK